MDIADYLLIAEEVLDQPAEQLKHSTNIGLAESALHAPFAGWGPDDLYPAVTDKAAILCSRLVRNHPLVDGNKRVAYEAMQEFLFRNGYQWVPPADDEVVDTIQSLTAGTLSEQDFAPWVAQHSRGGATATK